MELVTTTLPRPVTIDCNELTEAVTKVIWTADSGAAIQDGQLQLFPLSVGAVAEVTSQTLKANTPVSSISSSDTIARVFGAGGLGVRTQLPHLLHPGARCDTDLATERI